MSFTLCSSGAAIAEAGTDANATAIASGVLMARWSDNAEGMIEAETRRSWVANFTSQPAGIQNMLSATCAKLMAIDIIKYNKDGFLSLLSAQTNIDVLNDRANRNLNILEKFKSPELKTP